MSEATVNVGELEAKFEKKLTAKENEIGELKTKFDELNKSVTKAAVDAKNTEITSLTEAFNKAVENEKTTRVLVDQRDAEFKKLQAEIKTLQETVKTKNDELEKATKELAETKAKEVIATRIKAYRDKSKDSTSTNEDLAKKFATFSDEAFVTMVELVKPVEELKVAETEEEKAAKALEAVKAAQVTKLPDGSPAPTASETTKDGKSATAARLFASIFSVETKKE